MAVPVARDATTVQVAGTERMLDAVVALVARWGVAKTTLGDVAREAGCSRATLYRAFPGGKAALFLAAAQRELAVGLRAVTDAVDAAESLEDALTDGLAVPARRFHEHPALAFVWDHEPEVLAPHLAFGRLDQLLAAVGAFAAPHLTRFVPAAQAPEAAELVGRVWLSYATNPAAGVDLRRHDHARRLVCTYLLPGLAPEPIPSPTCEPTTALTPTTRS